ncbi:MAG TPA: hypothetical protein IAD08_07615 [Candidatus Scatovivens faecipullorum]|nr:hypothetical protein [Candidatus Scatovivens faecipullorum]
MNKSKKIIIGILIVLIIVVGIVVAYKIIEKSVTNRADFNFVVENISSSPVNTIDNGQNDTKLNRNTNNVTIEVDNTTISPESVTIIITDNNTEHFAWGIEFRVQKKVNEQWEDLEYVSDDLSWIDIAYGVNEDNQLTLKLDIEKYYGKLSNGIYRIVKPVYDNGYIDIYSNEFEIK